MGGSQSQGDTPFPTLPTLSQKEAAPPSWHHLQWHRGSPRRSSHGVVSGARPWPCPQPTGMASFLLHCPRDQACWLPGSFLWLQGRRAGGWGAELQGEERKAGTPGRGGWLGRQERGCLHTLAGWLSSRACLDMQTPLHTPIPPAEKSNYSNFILLGLGWWDSAEASPASLG